MGSSPIQGMAQARSAVFLKLYVMSKLNLETLSTKLAFFFNGVKKRKDIHLSYYLIGYRGDFLILRVSALADTMHRLYVYLRAIKRLQLSAWLLSFSTATLPISLWFANNNNFGLYAQLGRQYALIFWKQRFFAFRTFYFSITTLRFIGADTIFILTQPNNIGKYQIKAWKSFGIPTIGIESDITQLNRFSFCLPKSFKFSAGIVFYTRLLSYFWQN